MAGAIFFIFIIFIIYFSVLQQASASYNIAKTKTLPFNEAMTILEGTLNNPVTETDILPIIINRIYEETNNPELDPAALKNIKTAIDKKTEKYLKNLYPSANFYLALGRFYNIYFGFDKDIKNLDIAEIFLKKAISLNSKNIEIYWELSNTKAAQGDYGEQVVLLQKAIDIDPQLSNSYWYLAMVYKINGDNQNAEKIIKKIKTENFEWEEIRGEALRIASFFRNLGDAGTEFLLFEKTLTRDLKTIEKEIKDYIKNIKESGPSWAKLAIIYHYLGEKEKETKAIEKVRELDPRLITPLKTFLTESN